MVKDFQLIIIKRKGNKVTTLPIGAICHGCFGRSYTLKEGLCKYCFRAEKRDEKDKKAWEW